MTHILTKNLSVAYGSTTILKDINFEAYQGEFIAILGKSGNGKTTFLHALARLMPSQGEIFMPKKVGMIFQQYSLFPWLTVEQNMNLGSDDTMKTTQYLELVDLKEKMKAYPTELSGGQVQRIVLANALAREPEALLMDEPYSALDAYTRDAMQDWLLKVWNNTISIIFVTHSIEEALFLASRVLVLDNKKIIAEYKVPFSYPRQQSLKFTNEFNDVKREVSKLLKL